VQGTGARDLILLHGMGGSSSTWQEVIPHLDVTSCRITTLDLRGHGKSNGGETRFTYPQLTADILAVADAVGIQRAVIVTQSGSSKNAVHLAATAPNRVDGLVLVAPAGMGEVPLPREMLTWFFDHLARTGDIPAEFNPWFTSKIGTARASVAREYARTSRAILEASAELWVHTSVVEHAARVTQPVLVIAGAQEPLYHPDYQRRTTLASLPQARMEVLACGHFIPLEEPLAVATLVMQFTAAVN
jgi:pimeloyl-ACP methyl ester carboxylesterase